MNNEMNIDETLAVLASDVKKLIKHFKLDRRKQGDDGGDSEYLSEPDNALLENISTGITELSARKFFSKEQIEQLKVLATAVSDYFEKRQDEGITDTTNVVASDALFPLLQSQLGSRLGLNSHEMTCIIWKLGIKDKSEYHSETKTGKSTSAHKYSEKLVPIIERLLRRPQFLSECKAEYSKTFLQGKSRKKIIKR